VPRDFWGAGCESVPRDRDRGSSPAPPAPDPSRDREAFKPGNKIALAQRVVARIGHAPRRDDSSPRDPQVQEGNP
jgi:hypothetical protein